MPPPIGVARRNQLNRGSLYTAFDVVSSGLVRRERGTHEDFATRLLLTRISVKLIFMCENVDATDDENGVGVALLTP